MILNFSILKFDLKIYIELKNDKKIYYKSIKKKL